MKRTTIVLFALVMGLLILPNYSCDTEDLIGTFNSTIDGDSWSATAPGAVKTGSRFTITGIGTNKSIVLNTNGVTPGTYTMDVFSGSIQPFVYTPNLSVPQESYIGSSGSIILSEVTGTRLSGTFNVVATNTSGASVSLVGTFTNVIYSF
jgi:hypothetical protein